MIRLSSYRMISRGLQPHTNEKVEDQPTAIVLVKHNACLTWPLIEAQIKEAVSRIPFGKNLDIHLEFATEENPKETDVPEVLAREFEPALIHVAQDFMPGVEQGTYLILWRCRCRNSEHGWRSDRVPGPKLDGSALDVCGSCFKAQTGCEQSAFHFTLF